MAAGLGNYPSGTDSLKPARAISPVEESLQRLNGNISEMRKVILTLKEKLLPVLTNESRPDQPSGSTQTVEPFTISEKIKEQSDRLGPLIVELTEIIERLEV